MPKVGLRQNLELQTRNAYTKVNCEIGVSIEGRELPNMAVLGEALEAATEVFQQKVRESYTKVPERVETPVAEPYKVGS